MCICVCLVCVYMIYICVYVVWVYCVLRIFCNCQFLCWEDWHSSKPVALRSSAWPCLHQPHTSPQWCCQAFLCSPHCASSYSPVILGAVYKLCLGKSIIMAKHSSWTAHHVPVRTRGLCRREFSKTDWSLLPVGGQRQRNLSCPEEACHVPGDLDPQAVVYYVCELQKPELQVTNIPSECHSKL